ncbi:bifunctional folylpolyglutamate synthase/dihydrofolate synthase [Bacillus marinisedimentorum]|uniref:bifunctional folylpolyglutamate synthase/dihydrofolate synthase n=1 Tax=Bacillus marinisedimentorum TaxID=1821260 RepID=UPI0012FFCFA4|nr:Mur ligase family protein [Bacillus marinisedimentorum]
MSYSNFFKRYYSRTMNRKNGYHAVLLEKLLSHFDLDPREFQFIQIAGSAGKGSTAHFLSAILTASDVAHGLFTGPHLSRYEERFQINGEEMPAPDLEKLSSEVEKGLKTFQEEQELGHMHLMILIGLLWYSRNGIGLVVYENGVGGKSDPAILFDPLIAVLTEITKDHTQLLGTEIEDITADKAAIIKSGTASVICGMRSPAARSYLRALSETAAVPFLFFGEDFSVESRRSARGTSVFDYSGKKDLKRLELSAPGYHQIQNAATAIAAVCELAGLTSAGNEEAIRLGLQVVRIPARYEMVTKNGRNVVIDGAHNVLELETLARNLKNDGMSPQAVIFSASSNKNSTEMINSVFYPEARYDIVPSPFAERRVNKEAVERMMDSTGLTWEWQADAGTALNKAFQSTEKGDTILITGSLYFAGEARRLLMT